MTTAKYLGSGALFSLLLAGCGGGGGSDPVTEASFCQQKAEAECEVVDRCLTQEVACVNQRRDICEIFSDAAKTGTRTFKADNVSDCINKTRNAYSQPSVITPTQLAEVDRACNFVFQGSAEELEDCMVDYDCANKNHICDKGLCANRSMKGSGELCGNPGEVCNAGSFCMMTGATYRCEANVESGMTCNDMTPPCLENLRCMGGVCVDRVGTGADCTSDEDCLPASPYCDRYLHRCGPGLTFAGGSASCDDFGGGGGGLGGSGGGAGGGTGGGGGGSGGGAGGSTGDDGGAAGSGGNGDAAVD